MTARYRTIYSEPVREAAATRRATHGTARIRLKLRPHLKAGAVKSKRETHMSTTIEGPRIESLLNVESISKGPVNQPPGMDERRAVPRIRKRVTAKVISTDAAEAFRFTTNDINENGLYMEVPLTAGFRVGQRCEVVLSDDARESIYATVVRTEPLAKGPTPLIGAGLRFDQPMFI